ncbi:hypothetical protein HDU76_011489, partial [Blyttiomyces sp. JEL0837]
TSTTGFGWVSDVWKWITAPTEGNQGLKVYEPVHGQDKAHVNDVDQNKIKQKGLKMGSNHIDHSLTGSSQSDLINTVITDKGGEGEDGIMPDSFEEEGARHRKG